ncbi:MAG: hypothetical protein QM774_11065 [Gordonia sp. (in: high G+C Gram-positive bacteria)]|uniref:hypothetical protein n=1 Tax=Gordonia sp. (in: high G+C Gram-positive bacteria) TaxID=84139 RepID=UPI0039E60AB6
MTRTRGSGLRAAVVALAVPGLLVVSACGPDPAADAAPTVFTDWEDPVDAVRTLTYSDDGREVTCTMPDVFADEIVTPSGCAVRFYRKDLMKTAIDLRVGPAHGVWLLTPAEAQEPIVVQRVTGQTLRPDFPPTN